MGESVVSTPKISVHLVISGVGVRDYDLPEGATLAELLRRSGTSTAGRAIFVDGFPLEDGLPLHDGAIVTIAPSMGNYSGADEPWRTVVPAFRDEALFREYSQILREHRHEGDSPEGQAG